MSSPCFPADPSDSLWNLDLIHLGQNPKQAAPASYSYFNTDKNIQQRYTTHLHILNAENTKPNKAASVFCLVTSICTCYIIIHQIDNLSPLHFPRLRIFLFSIVSYTNRLWHSQKVNTFEQPIHLQAITVLQIRASTDHISIR